MQLNLRRVLDRKNATLGIISVVDDDFFTLEDEFQEEKIAGETRIPAGKYEIKLRKEGGMNERYSKAYDYHEGMLWLQDVPSFSWIYIHVGNRHENTSGCILVGEQSSLSEDNPVIHYSAAAYKAIYLSCAEAFQRGEKVFINISD